MRTGSGMTPTSGTSAGASTRPKAVPRVHDENETHYIAFLDALDANARALGIADRLFTVDTVGLWDAYLAALPASERAYHTCHECRRFIERFGGVVLIGADGEVRSALWQPIGLAPGSMYRKVASKLKALVEKRKLTGVFVSSEKRWGTPRTGVWTHIAAAPVPKNHVFVDKIKTAEQRAAEYAHEYETLKNGLAAYPRATVEQALDLLQTGKLYRSEGALAAATWLSNLHAKLASTPKTRRDALLWRAAATAPTGFCHVKSTMVGTLLDDLVAGLPFDEIKKRFDSKMDPKFYQRPQAAPAAQNLARAEKLVEQLGIERSLLRRYALLSEVPTLWTPRPVVPEVHQGPVFGGIRPKGAIDPTPTSPISGTTPITWMKFARDVLPRATRIDWFSTGGITRVGFGAQITAQLADAPPILQWDREDARNPLSYYVYQQGSTASHWNLPSFGTAEVVAITRMPWEHNNGAPHRPSGIMLVLKGARDSYATTSYSGVSMCLFPEFLRGELHEVRASIEAFSNKHKLPVPPHEQLAAGLLLMAGQDWTNAPVVRVTTAGGTAAQYRIDRWE
jgi:hypothetical protein